MKPINLRPHEARRLAEAGEVLVVRPANPQPSEGFDCFWVVGDDGFEIECTDGLDPVPDNLSKACPFPEPVAKVWGRETWGYAEPIYCFESGGLDGFSEGDKPDPRDKRHKVLFKANGEDGGESADDRGFSWRSAATMPKWASRFPSLVVASRRFCRLSGLTVDDMTVAGLSQYVIALDGRAYDNFERAACKATKRLDPAATCVSKAGEFHAMWDRDNPKHPAASDPWVWAALMRREDV